MRPELPGSCGWPGPLPTLMRVRVVWAYTKYPSGYSIGLVIERSQVQFLVWPLWSVVEQDPLFQSIQLLMSRCQWVPGIKWGRKFQLFASFIRWRSWCDTPSWQLRHSLLGAKLYQLWLSIESWSIPNIDIEWQNTTTVCNVTIAWFK